MKVNYETREYVVAVQNAVEHDAFERFENECSPSCEIVRCKDCWKRNYDNCPFYDSFDKHPQADWFCADGQRKQDK